MWNFKGYLWNSTQNILPVQWKISQIYELVCVFKTTPPYSNYPPPTPHIPAIRLMVNTGNSIFFKWSMHYAMTIFRGTIFFHSFMLFINDIFSIIQVLPAIWMLTNTRPTYQFKYFHCIEYKAVIEQQFFNVKVTFMNISYILRLTYQVVHKIMIWTSVIFNKKSFFNDYDSFHEKIQAHLFYPLCIW